MTEPDHARMEKMIGFLERKHQEAEAIEGLAAQRKWRELARIITEFGATSDAIISMDTAKMLTISEQELNLLLRRHTTNFIRFSILPQVLDAILAADAALMEMRKLTPK